MPRENSCAVHGYIFERIFAKMDFVCMELVKFLARLSKSSTPAWIGRDFNYMIELKLGYAPQPYWSIHTPPSSIMPTKCEIHFGTHHNTAKRSRTLKMFDPRPLIVRSKQWNCVLHAHTMWDPYPHNVRPMPKQCETYACPHTVRLIPTQIPTQCETHAHTMWD